MNRFSVLAYAAVAASGFGVRAVSAASVEFSGSSGSLAAKAIFDVTGDTLTVTLQNTATIPTLTNASLLENVFWNSDSLGTVGTTAYLSGATIPTGSGPVWPSDDSSNFGVYGFGVGTGGPVTGKYGVGGTAYLLGFDSGHLVALNGSTPNPTTSPNGPNGGLASDETLMFFSKNAIADTLVFTIHLANTLDVNSIRDVVFTYGTGAKDFRSIPPSYSVPVPAAVWAGGAMLALFGVRRLLRRGA